MLFNLLEVRLLIIVAFLLLLLLQSWNPGALDACLLLLNLLLFRGGWLQSCLRVGGKGLALLFILSLLLSQLLLEQARFLPEVRIQIYVNINYELLERS